LILIESAEAAAFKRDFDARFACGEALSAGAKKWSFLPLIESLGASCAETVSVALSTLRQGIDHIGDSFKLGCESPRFVRRKHRVSAVEIDMHPVIKSQDRTSGDERDVRFGFQIAGRQENSFKRRLCSPKGGRF